MTIGAAVTIVGSLLTWVRSGGVSRNSYDIFRLVGRLGFAPDGPAATALRWWPVMPLLAVTGVVAVWWTWPRTGGLLGVLAACYAGVVAVAVLAAPAEGLVDIGFGPAVSSVGAAGLLAGSVLALSARSTATALQHLPEDRRPIGHDAVDAEVEQAVHLVFIVDRPHVDLDAAPVRAGDEAFVDDREACSPSPAPGRSSYGVTTCRRTRSSAMSSRTGAGAHTGPSRSRSRRVVAR